MGFNTAILINNDLMLEIDRDPEAWWHRVRIAAVSRRESCPYGTKIISMEHSSTTVIAAIGGNTSTVLGYGHDVNHRTEEGQVALLKALAEKLGYVVAKKPQKTRSTK